MNSPIPYARIFFPFAVGYFLSYLYRTVNNVIAPHLVADLGLEAGDLGLLTGTYFLTFAAFQLPLGILLDRYSPKKVEAGLLLFAALGAYVFSAADSVTGLLVGRALIGFGVSACLMAAFKSFVDWFPKEKLPLVNGCQMTAGGLGALVATQPVEWAMTVTDWRGMFFVLAVLSLLVAALIFIVVPDKQRDGGHVTLIQQLGGIKEIFTHPLFLRAAPITIFSQMAFLSVIGLWSGPWLKDVAGMAATDVPGALFYISASMIAGFLSIGAIAARLDKAGIRPFTVALAGMGTFMVFQLVVISGWTAYPVLIWCLYGFFGTIGILPYAALSQCFPPHLAGRLNTALNVVVFFLAFVAQWGIGAIIDLWDKAPGGGFNPAGYAYAFTALLALQVLALGWLILYRKAELPLKHA